MDYNKNMDYVDYFEQMKSTYETDRKCKKWWHQIFFHLLEVTVINSFLSYCMHSDSDFKLKILKSFQMDLIGQLIAMGNDHITESRKTHISPIRVKKHKLHVPNEKRLKNVDNMPVRSTFR